MTATSPQATLDYVLGVNLTRERRIERLNALAAGNDMSADCNLRAARRAIAAGRLKEAADCTDAAEFYNNRARRLRAEARQLSH